MKKGKRIKSAKQMYAYLKTGRGVFVQSETGNTPFILPALTYSRLTFFEICEHIELCRVYEEKRS